MSCAFTFTKSIPGDRPFDLLVDLSETGDILCLSLDHGSAELSDADVVDVIQQLKLLTVNLNGMGQKGLIAADLAYVFKPGTQEHAIADAIASAQSTVMSLNDPIGKALARVSAAKGGA